ncbi:MAG: TatD family hydrolase [Pseudomonadota bacterium]
MLIDSHCHLNFLDDTELALDRAVQAGVTGCLCIGVDEEHIGDVLKIAQREGIWSSVGEHPGSCSGDATWVKNFLSEPRVVAVGEMGLDYFYVEDLEQQAQQRKTFRQQMSLAAEFDLPVIIHTRQAEKDTLSILADFPRVRGVLHCFTESWSMAEAALDMGYYVSISGIVTFKNAANVRDVAIRVPDDRLLIETDSPWLAPVPHRGQQNQPAYVRETAAFLSELRSVTQERLLQQTSDNFFKLFARANSEELLV